MLYVPSHRSRPLPSAAPAALMAVLIALLPLLQLHPLDLPPITPDPAAALSRLDQRPLSFMPSQQQSNPAVQFQTATSSGTMFFMADGVQLTAPDGAASVRLRFDDANPVASISGVDQRPGVVNDLRGSDPAQWRTNVPTFASLVYGALYPGIDLRYDGADGRLKGTYTVAAGVDPALIRWRYDGATGTQLDSAGNLLVGLSGGQTLTEAAPVAWQEIGGRRVPVASRYTLAADSSASFALGSYDAAHPLIIDPTIEFDIEIGGSDQDGGNAVGLDSAGNFYIAGTTRSTDFPAVNPFASAPPEGCSYIDDRYGDVEPTACFNTFVAKWDPTGSLIYVTFVAGGRGGRISDIAVDGAGHVYLTGHPDSQFPITPGAFQTSGQNIFVAKLNQAGNALLYSTYLNGPNTAQSRAIAIDSSGNAYITGWAQAGFPVLNAVQPTHRGGEDSFVAKLNARGSALVYSTYLGGSGGDIAEAIAVDSSGNAYVTGHTNAADFPVRNALQATSRGQDEGFVAKLNASGSALVYSTYLGGSGGDIAKAIAVDSSGNAYIGGRTNSADFPLLNPLQATSQGGNEAFVTKLNPAGSALAYSTLLGGSSNDGITALAVNSGGSVYLTGSTDSLDFPTARPWQPDNSVIYCYDPEEEGYCSEGEGFVTKLSANGGRLDYSSYNQWPDGSGDIAIDQGGNAYLVGGRDGGFCDVIEGRPVYCDNVAVIKISPNRANSLTNGGFEADSDTNGTPDGWSSNTRASRSSAVVRSGSAALRHQASDNASYTIFSDPVSSVTGGQLYSVSGWVNIPATSDSFSVELQVRWRYRDGSVLSTETVGSYTTATSGWANTAAVLVAPPNAAQATIRQVVTSLNATVYVDDVTFGHIDNWVPNSGFDADRYQGRYPRGWSTNSHVSRQYENYDENAVLAHRATDNASYTIFSDPIQGITPGESYGFATRVNIPATSDSFGLELQVRWRDAAGNVISTIPVTSYTAATSGWTTATAVLVAPSNAAQATLRQVVTNLNATIYVDDVTFGQ